MKQKLSLSPAGKFTVLGLAVATTGVIIQIVSGADYPKIPPAFFILLVPAGLIVFSRWRWAPVIAVLGGLFLTFGFISSGSLTRMLSLNNFGVATGLWVQMLGVAAAFIAGIIATMQNYRIKMQ